MKSADKRISIPRAVLFRAIKEVVLKFKKTVLLIRLAMTKKQLVLCASGLSSFVSEGRRDANYYICIIKIEVMLEFVSVGRFCNISGITVACRFALNGCVSK